MPKPVAMALLVLLTGCTVTPSEVAPDATITLAGGVAYQDGGAAAGVPVTLVRHEGVAETLSAVLTLGATCLDGEKSLSVCKDARRATTRRDGQFSFALKGRETQGLLGDASRLEATAHVQRTAHETAGASASIRFLVQTEQVKLPMRVWEPDVDVITDGRSGTVTWTDIPAAIVAKEIDPSAAVERVLFGRAPGEIVWVLSGRSGVATFDPRVLEDARGAVWVAAEWAGQTVPDDRGRTIDVILRSGRRPYRSRAGAPPSRGAACARQTAAGGDALSTMSPCRLTDGDFAVPAGPPSCQTGAPCEATTAMVLDWGAPRPVALVVVRGCTERCRVETSADARRWTPAGIVEAGDAALALLKPVSARYVRVAGPHLDSLREVSMWQPPGPAAKPTSIIAEVGGLAPPLERLIRRDGRTAPIAAAALLLALIGGAVGATSLQRRPARPRS